MCVASLHHKMTPIFSQFQNVKTVAFHTVFAMMALVFFSL